GAFAGLDHGGMERRKNFGELAHGFVQGFAIGDGSADFLKENDQIFAHGGADQSVYGAKQRDAGADEVGKLAIHDADIPTANAFAFAGAGGFVLAFGGDRDGEEIALFERAKHGGFVVGFEFAVDFLSGDGTG